VTAVGLLAQAPVTALIAALVLGERPSMAQMAGGVLVLAGVYLVIQRPRTMSRLPAPAD
jgi:drug/metabolite transporter (DMT)-like permease